MEAFGLHFLLMEKAIQIENSWKFALKNEWEKPYFNQLKQFVRKEYQSKQILPAGNNIFEAFNQCPFEKVKVIILGQDPYPTPGHAHGLAFSVEPDVKPLPKSLNNIFKEIQDDIGIEFPTNGDLRKWAKQGVFLLNTVLTLEANKSNSHAGKGWELFTDEVIRQLNKERENLVFMLWGSNARQKKQLINSNKHFILEAPHPSPLSAYRGFFGCNHFSKANAFLNKTRQTAINW